MVIDQLTGQLVNTTIRANVPVKITGTLMECDEIIIRLDRGKISPTCLFH